LRPDWPDFGYALWQVSDQLGIRPEWQLPVISMETGGSFDPGICNSGGCCGLNQFCPGTYQRYVHVPVADYRTWMASQQLAGPILNFWRDALNQGPIRSSTRLMLAQLGTALLKSAPNLTSVVFADPSAAYKQNQGFDTAGKGYITVQDLADAMARQASTFGVQDALARTYALRPNERPRDPVYGDDWTFASPPQPQPVVRPPTQRPSIVGPLAGAAVLAVAAGYATLHERRRLRTT
jgi:hypothetical protein